MEESASGNIGWQAVSTLEGLAVGVRTSMVKKGWQGAGHLIKSEDFSHAPCRSAPGCPGKVCTS